MVAVPGFDDVLRARERIAGRAVRTPLLFSPVLSEQLGGRVFLKPECLQRTGSFKFRGAWNAVAALGESGRGVVACSSGNHAQGVAEAARLAGIPAVIVMPEDAPVPKRERTARSGGRIVLYDRIREDREAIAQAIAQAEGLHFIHPYNDELVIAGQGTVGLEVAEDCSPLGIEPELVLVPCSGGGLAAGVALAVTERFPAAAVYTAEPAAFDDYARSLANGTRETNAGLSGSVCDALLAPAPGAIGWEINRERLAGGVTATDEEALDAVAFAFDEARLVVEPGGAVGLAALRSGRIPLRGRTAVVVLSGGNVSDDVMAAALRAYRSGRRFAVSSAA